jgi:hypothetical protein
VNKSVHSVWFGLLAEVGYPGLGLFAFILFIHWRTLVRLRKRIRKGEVPAVFGYYASALEASLVAFVVGGTFLPIHYNEMLWHLLALGIALDRAAAIAMAGTAVQEPSTPLPIASTAAAGSGRPPISRKLA